MDAAEWNDVEVMKKEKGWKIASVHLRLFVLLSIPCPSNAAVHCCLPPSLIFLPHLSKEADTCLIHTMQRRLYCFSWYNGGEISNIQRWREKRRGNETSQVTTAEIKLLFYSEKWKCWVTAAIYVEGFKNTGYRGNAEPQSRLVCNLEPSISHSILI